MSADNKSRVLRLVLTVVLVGANLVALNYLVSGWSTARLDLTENRHFSISPATKRILRTLDEEVTVYGYFSGRTHPKLAPLVPEIVDLLEEYRAVSRGRVRVEIIDPGEDEEAEQEASDRYGVRSTPFRLASKYETGIVNAYFALVVRYGDQYERYGFQDLIDIEMLPDGDINVRLRNLEYDLTRAIKKTVYGFQTANELFERLDGPIKLTAIISRDTLPDVLSEVPDAVDTAAQELKERGGDKFVYEVIDPSQDDALKQELMAKYGVRPMSLSFLSEGTFYLYGLLEIEGRLEQLILTGESISAAAIREAIESSLKRHTPGFLKTVGVVAPEQPDIPPEVRRQLQMPPQPPPEFQEIKRFLGQEYQVENVALNAANGVPSNVDLLLVLKPKGLDEKALFHLDQYLMRGGRVVLCAGTYESSFSATGLSVLPVDSGLDEWLAHHGLSVEKTLVLDDRNQALPIPQTRQTALGTLRTWELAPYPYLIQVRDDGLVNRNVTASLDAVGIYWGSPVSVDEEKTAELEVIPILRSSARSWTNDDTSQVGFVDYEVPAEPEPQTLALALSGRFRSFFAGKQAPLEQESPTLEQDGPDGLGESVSTPAPVVPLEESPETRLVVVGNSDFLSDFVARSIGQMDGSFFVENLRFVENLIDWTTLDNDMISIRSAGHMSRRITPVDNEAWIEGVNYGIPILTLIGLGAYLAWKRRNVTPICAEPGPALTAPRPQSKEV